MRATNLSETFIVTLVFIIIILSNVIVFNVNSATSQPPNSGSRGVIPDDAWASTKIWADDEQLKDVAIGDIDPTHDGNEIVVGGDSQRVTMLNGEEHYWKAKRIWYDDWYTNAVEIGDIDPQRDGEEVVVVGWSGRITMIYWENNKWQTQELGRRMDYLYDVAVGEVIPSVQGNEVLVVGDDGEVSIFTNNNSAGKTWLETVIFHDIDYLHTIAVGDCDPDFEGAEILVSGGSSSITMLYFNDDNWTAKTIWTDVKTINSIAIGEFYSGHSGNEIVVVGTSNNAVMLTKNGTVWENNTIWEDTNDLYNVKIGDIDPINSGNEIVTCGLSNRVVILQEPSVNDTNNASNGNTNWDAVVLTAPAEDNVYILATALGDFDPSHDGSEIVTVGYLGKVVKTQYEELDFNIYPVQPTQVVNAGKDTEFVVILTPHGGFNEMVYLELLGSPLPSGIETDLDKDQIIPTDIVKLTISTSVSTPEGSYEITVKGTNSNASIAHQLNLTVIVEPAGTPDFKLIAKPDAQSVVADFSTVFIIDIESLNNYEAQVELFVSRLPTGVTAKFNHTSITPPGAVNLTLQTSTITTNLTYYIPIKGLDDQGLEHSIIITLVVGATGKQDFLLAAAPTTQFGLINRTVEYNIEVISLFGFKSMVNLNVIDLPSGVIANFNPNSVFPTANVTLEINITETTLEGQYDLRIDGYYSNIKHSIIVKLIVIYQAPEFELSVVPPSTIINISESAEFKINIIPNSAFRETVTLTIEGLPSNIFWNEDLTPVYIETPTELKLKLQTRATTALGTYNLTFSIRSESGLEHNATVELEIISPGNTKNDKNELDPTIFYYGAILLLIIVIWIGGYYKYKTKRDKK